MTGSAELVLTAGDVELRLAPCEGGRVASLRIGGLELLRTVGSSPLAWGSYPMAPWAGRVRHGRFTFGNREFGPLPLHADGHAIHGTVVHRVWRVDSDGALVTDLGAEWPFPGRVRQAFELREDRLRCRLEVSADAEPMPVSCGWHPWFLRKLAAGGRAQLTLRAGYMERRDAEGIATEERLGVTQGPWDECFGDVRWPVTITWPGALRLAIASDCPYLVVFDEPLDALCIEPQTGPPDALNRGSNVAEPGAPLVAEMVWTWEPV